ncbi:MAG: hypothetical protein U9P44_00075 [archaeon]|nr:hypothetical protein [archaeon]
MKKQELSLPEGKLGLFWILGAIAMTSGAWVLGMENQTSIHFIMSFILILFAGLSWVGVAVGVFHRIK